MVLADALVGEIDIQEVMLGLIEHCVQRLGAAASGVLLIDPRETLQVRCRCRPVADVGASTGQARGIGSVYATPLRARDTVIGTLNLFGRAQTAMNERDLLIVRAVADVAAVTIV